MNRRKLKKNIHNIYDELVYHLLITSYLDDSNASAEKRAELFGEIQQKRVDLIKRVSHVEPGSEKLYFHKLRKDTLQAAEELLKKIAEID